MIRSVVRGAPARPGECGQQVDRHRGQMSDGPFRNVPGPAGYKRHPHAALERRALCPRGMVPADPA